MSKKQFVYMGGALLGTTDDIETCLAVLRTLLRNQEQRVRDLRWLIDELCKLRTLEEAKA